MPDIVNAVKKLAEAFKSGLVKKDDLEALRRELRRKRKNNYEILNIVQDELSKVREKALRLKQEYDREIDSNIKKVIAVKIKRTFHRMDSLVQKARLADTNIGKITTALNKIEEVQVLGEQGVSEEHYDEIAIHLEDLIDDSEAVSMAEQDLVKIKAPVSSLMDEDDTEEIENLFKGEMDSNKHPGLTGDLYKQLEEMEESSS